MMLTIHKTILSYEIPMGFYVPRSMLEELLPEAWRVWVEEDLDSDHIMIEMRGNISIVKLREIETRLDAWLLKLMAQAEEAMLE